MQAEALMIATNDTNTDKDEFYLFLSFDNAMKTWKELNKVPTLIVSGIKPMTILDFEEFFNDTEELEKTYDADNVLRFSK